MSCHYSCSTCSRDVYFDTCTACPTTRTLTFGSTCPCSDGYYQSQVAQCTADADLPTIDSYVINVSNVAYYVAIGLHFMVILMAINRILSVKAKKIVDTLQITALVAYYRYQFDQTAQQSLRIMEAFNFYYLQDLVCTRQAPPYGCSTFQNLVGVCFAAMVFVGLFLVAYCIANCIHSCQKQEDNIVYIRDGNEVQGSGGAMLGLTTYIKSLCGSFFLIYLDHTSVMTTLAVCRIAIVNNLGFLLAVPLLLLLIIVGRLHFKTVNAQAQTTLAYRAKHRYFFHYDDNYHLNYIDHLFQAGEQQQHLNQTFYPHSNLMVLQLMHKVFLAASTIVFYEYGPYLFAWCAGGLMLIPICRLGVFSVYQVSDLCFYLMTYFLYCIAIATFPLNFFGFYIFFVAIGLLILLVVTIIATLLSWRNDRDGEMFKKTFELENRSQSQTNESEDELINKKPKSEEEPQIIEVEPILAEDDHDSIENRRGPSKLTSLKPGRTSPSIKRGPEEPNSPEPEARQSPSPAPVTNRKIKRRIKYNNNLAEATEFNGTNRQPSLKNVSRLSMNTQPKQQSLVGGNDTVGSIKPPELSIRQGTVQAERNQASRMSRLTGGKREQSIQRQANRTVQREVKNSRESGRRQEVASKASNQEQ